MNFIRVFFFVFEDKKNCFKTRFNVFVYIGEKTFLLLQEKNKLELKIPQKMKLLKNLNNLIYYFYYFLIKATPSVN